MRPIYIFDLDGTLSNAEHRVHLWEAKDFDAFYAASKDDPPIEATCKTMRNLIASGALVWIWTGRRDTEVHSTMAWLRENRVVPAWLQMRPAEDRREDHVLKAEWLERTLDVDRERIVAVFEDRKRVVDMWRANGLTCYQVAPGEF